MILPRRSLGTMPDPGSQENTRCTLFNLVAENNIKFKISKKNTKWVPNVATVFGGQHIFPDSAAIIYEETSNIPTLLVPGPMEP